jgi:hypothetical protein
LEIIPINPLKTTDTKQGLNRNTDAPLQSFPWLYLSAVRPREEGTTKIIIRAVHEPKQ